MSYKVEVQTGGDKWDSNLLRFPTEEKARAYGSDLASRWFLVSDWRVVESDDAPTEK